MTMRCRASYFSCSLSFVVGLLFEDFIDELLRVYFAVGQRKSFGEGDLEVGVFGFEFEGGFQLGDRAVVVFEATEGFAGWPRHCFGCLGDEITRGHG